MNTCKTCKWWKQPKEIDEEDRADISNGRVCSCPKTVFGDQRYASSVDRVVLDDATEEPIDPSGAAVLDGSGYWGCLVTGPDFGCVNHEEA